MNESPSTSDRSKRAGSLNPRNWSWGTILLFVPPLAAVALVGVTLRHHDLNETFFVNSAFYVIFAMLAVYAGIELTGLGETTSPRQWLMDNRTGILVTALVSTVVLLAVAPSYRVLADEANLVGVSKNLFYQRTANFATTGKWYFENFWNINIATDRRPALFPFLISLLHVLRGYHPENAFHVNAIIFILFVFSSYRLAKSFGGELFGAAAAILVATNPNTLLSARSAGFDLLSSFMLLIVIKSFVEYAKQSTPRRLAILSLHLCILAHVRYEGWALLLAALAVLLVFRMIRRSHLQGYSVLYSFLPIFLVPRYWQTVAKAHDAEQPLSASLFKISNFIQNAGEYLRLVTRPLEVGGPHSPLLMILAAAGCLLVLLQLVTSVRSKKLTPLTLKTVVFIAVLLGLETVISFSYLWGKALHPSAARLFIWLDTFVALTSAWFLTVLGRRLAAPVAMLKRKSAAPVTLLTCFALFAMHVPAASEGRFINTLILTRQAAQTWRYFEKLGNKNILILSDRPGLFTIMNYGALDISSANSNRSPLLELSRHLYEDVYLVQEVDLNTHQPLPAFDAWPDVPKETVFEFQSTDSASVRIARIKH